MSTNGVQWNTSKLRIQSKNNMKIYILSCVELVHVFVTLIPQRLYNTSYNHQSK